MAWTMLPSLTLQRAVNVATTATLTATSVLMPKREWEGDEPSGPAVDPSDWDLSTASVTASVSSLMGSYDTLKRRGSFPVAARPPHRQRPPGALPDPEQDRVRRDGRR